MGRLATFLLAVRRNVDLVSAGRTLFAGRSKRVDLKPAGVPLGGGGDAVRTEKVAVGTQGAFHGYPMRTGCRCEQACGNRSASVFLRPRRGLESPPPTNLNGQALPQDVFPETSGK